jgi:hypothetical protein
MTRVALGLCLAALAVAAPAGAYGQPENVAAEASRRFQRGVQLYNEGDFRGAVVEFRKAYTLLPRASALYNIGQTEFQLREYASALRTLERFLVETSPKSPHHAEVRDSVEVLRDRVGHIDLTADQEGCEVTVDDQRVGLTPLTEPVLVSIGRRRVAVGCAGGARAAREVDVAARDTVRVALEVGRSAPAPVNLSAARAPAAQGPTRSWRPGALSWTANAVLAAATATAYTAALLGSRQLQQLRNSYPVTLEQLEAKARLNRRWAVAGDVLAITTLAAAGLTTYLSLGASDERVRVAVSPGGVSAAATF